MHYLDVHCTYYLTFLQSKMQFFNLTNPRGPQCIKGWETLVYITTITNNHNIFLTPLLTMIITNHLNHSNKPNDNTVIVRKPDALASGFQTN